TERKQTERRLSSSENKYRSLVELAGDAIFLADIATGTIVDCNKNATELLGKTKDEIIGSHQSELHPADKASYYQKVFKSHIETGNDIAEDLLVVHKDGHTIPVDIRATVIKFEDVTLILGIFRNITLRKQQNDELNRTKKRYDLATSIGKIGIWDWNFVTGDLVWNDETFRIFGFEPNALRPSYELFLDMIHPKDRKNLDSAVQAALFEKKDYSEDCRVLLGNGEKRICHATGEVEFNEAGEPVRMLGTFQDITERKQAEEALRIAATAFESQEGVLVTDANQAILRVNQAFTNITGYTAEEVTGKTPRILCSGRHDTHFYATMWDCINNTGSWQGEVWNQRKDGEIYPAFLAITEVTGQNGMITNYVATFTDTSLSKAAAEKIEYLAFYDPLTGLPNRRLLQDRLQAAMASSHRSGRQGGLLFMDADNFKILNDTLGHDKGDLLLQLIARRLEPCVRECDTVARLGGDEFVLMLEDLSEQTLDAAAQIEVIGNKILATLNQPYLLGMNEYRNTASIGATLFNGHEQSADELLKQADIAMYQAKASGRNTLRFFDPQMQATISARVELEADLRLALKENQFMLYYQPQVRHNRQIMGAEVLVRWQHPQRALVFPGDFIPLAEETNLILPIGQWVLETACAQIKMWEGSEHTRHLDLAVNVSACQFYQADFVEQVTQVINCTMISPDKLKLELTESLVLNDIDDTILKMKALRQIGVRFSMDDFGTGYSSLASLKKLPISQLKIDKSFVRDILNDPDDMIIVRTIIAMAKNMGLSVIAEGVETEAQRVFLEQHDCPVFQGYLFSKPVPIDQFELLLKRNLKRS
ncbi:MAG: EAL domain-containing protein, partial [Methylococcaceae bacterium]